MMGFWDGSGISWTMCKQSAPCSRQITTPTPHQSIFTGRLLFLKPNQQHQSTEGKKCSICLKCKINSPRKGMSSTCPLADCPGIHSSSSPTSVSLLVSRSVEYRPLTSCSRYRPGVALLPGSSTCTGVAADR